MFPGFMDKVHGQRLTYVMNVWDLHFALHHSLLLYSEQCMAISLFLSFPQLASEH